MRKLFFLIPLLFLANSASAAGQLVTYTIGTETFEGYFAPAGESAPLVVIVHDWDGLNDYEVKRADMLVELGYSVFAVDLFGKGIRPEEMEERKKLTSMLYNDRERMRALLNGGLEQAEKLGGNLDNAVAMGYCFGGAAILELARSAAEPKAYVSFHGGLETPEGQDYSQTKGEILVFHGSADESVSLEQFAALAKELEEQQVRHEMITYSGAPHAFTVFGSDRYREEADRRSWQRFTQFLEQTLR